MFFVEASRGFIESPQFTQKWFRYGLTDEQLLILQIQLLDNPKTGPVMRGTGRLRKVRFAFDYRGKSGSARVLYIDFEEHRMVFLVDFFAKEEKDNLTRAERSIIRKRIPEIAMALFGGTIK